MTREEAIKYFKQHLDLYCVDGISREAEEMAIQALSQEPTEKPMTVDEMEREYEKSKALFHKIVECDDAISRILKRMWNCRGKHTTSIDKVAMEQIIRDELLPITQNPIECDDVISREAVYNILKEYHIDEEEIESAMDECQNLTVNGIISDVSLLPSVTQKSGKCKNCKYFEYNSVAKVDGIPLIVAHEICNKWGGGCKTKEDGYCYLFEPQESEVRNEM